MKTLLFVGLMALGISGSAAEGVLSALPGKTIRISIDDIPKDATYTIYYRQRSDSAIEVTSSLEMTNKNLKGPFCWVTFEQPILKTIRSGKSFNVKVGKVESNGPVITAYPQVAKKDAKKDSPKSPVSDFGCSVDKLGEGISSVDFLERFGRSTQGSLRAFSVSSAGGSTARTGK